MIDTGKTEEWLQQTEEWLQHDDHRYEVLQAMGMELLAEVMRLREGIKAYLDLEIETHELKEMIEWRNQND